MCRPMCSLRRLMETECVKAGWLWGARPDSVGGFGSRWSGRNRLRTREVGAHLCVNRRIGCDLQEAAPTGRARMRTTLGKRSCQLWAPGGRRVLSVLVWRQRQVPHAPVSEASCGTVSRLRRCDPVTARSTVIARSVYRGDGSEREC